MLKKVFKYPAKAVSVFIQLFFIAGLALWLFWIFREKAGTPEFEREQWTQRDGFMAISYSSMTKEPKDGLNCRDQFASHLRALKKAGYKTVTDGDIIDFYNNNKPLPEKALYLMTEGGRKESAIFGQEHLLASRFHASFFTYTGTLSNWDNFFATYSNISTIAKNIFWNVGSQGVRLLRINENIPDQEPGYFLCDYLRDEAGERVESDERMLQRLGDYYRESFDPLASLMDEPPLAYIFMPANSFSAYMPEEVSRANQKFMRQYFKMAFTREGPAFNSSLGSVYALSRMNVKPEWSAEELLEALKKWLPGRERFYAASAESAEDWTANRTTVEIDGSDILLTPADGFVDPAMLRGSELWDNLEFSVTFDKRDPGERFIYLRYSARDSYLRLTLRANRLMIHERLPGVGLVNIYDEVIHAREPWKFDILLKGDRLGLTLNGGILNLGSLPLSRVIKRGGIALGSAADSGYQARFGKVEARLLPTVWQDSLNGEIVLPERFAAEGVTARILPLPTGVDEELVARELLQTGADGTSAIAALPAGSLDFRLDQLLIKPLSEEEALKLWDGVMVSPVLGSDWARVEAALKTIRGYGFEAVLRLSLETAAALAASGAGVDADRFILDFTDTALPKKDWIALANRHHRNRFLYQASSSGPEAKIYTPGKAVEFYHGN